MTQFKRVVIYARHYRATPGISDTIYRLKEFLLSLKLTVLLEHETSQFITDSGLANIDMMQLGNPDDLIVVVGGDGNLLSAARLAIKVDVPVVGINRGRLGFLTDVTPQQIETKLHDVLCGKYQEEQRFLLHSKIGDGQQICHECDALNEIALTAGDDPRMIEFDVSVNQKFISHYRADGIIVATPTGSTAHALSGGGPILHPTLNAIALVPILPHTLSSRPIVIDAQNTIELHVSETNESGLRISCDGHERILVKPGQSIMIHKATQKLRLLHPDDYNYYETLRSKLGWEGMRQGPEIC